MVNKVIYLCINHNMYEHSNLKHFVCIAGASVGVTAAAVTAAVASAAATGVTLLVEPEAVAAAVVQVKQTWKTALFTVKTTTATIIPQTWLLITTLVILTSTVS